MVNLVRKQWKHRLMFPVVSVLIMAISKMSYSAPNPDKIYKFEPTDQQKIGFLLDMVRKGVRMLSEDLLSQTFSEQIFDSASNSVILNPSHHILTLTNQPISPEAGVQLANFALSQPLTPTADFNLTDSAIVIEADSAVVYCALFFWASARDSIGNFLPQDSWQTKERLIFRKQNGSWKITRTQKFFSFLNQIMQTR